MKHQLGWECQPSHCTVTRHKKTEDMAFVRISDDVVTVTSMSNGIENRQTMIKGLQFSECSAMLTER